MKEVRNNKKESNTSDTLATVRTANDSSNVIASLDNIVELGVPLKSTILELDSLIKEALSPRFFDLSELFQQQFDEMRRLQEEFVNPVLEIVNMLKPFADVSQILKDAAATSFNMSKLLEEATLTLPSSDLKKVFGLKFDFQLLITKFETITTTNVTSHPLTNITTNTTFDSRIDTRIIAGFEMKLSLIEAKVDDVDTTLKLLLNDSRQKDEAISELVKFIKTGGQSTDKISSIEINQAATQLSLNGHAIKIQKNQSLLCKVMFSSEIDLTVPVEIDDIITMIGEESSDKDWHRAMYDAAYQLNKKIQAELGIKSFLLPTSRTITVNPIYL